MRFELSLKRRHTITGIRHHRLMFSDEVLKFNLSYCYPQTFDRECKLECRLGLSNI